MPWPGKYIKLLLQNLDVLILNQHWLWPLELDTLGSIDNDFEHVAVSDKRL